MGHRHSVATPVQTRSDSKIRAVFASSEHVQCAAGRVIRLKPTVKGLVSVSWISLRFRVMVQSKFFSMFTRSWYIRESTLYSDECSSAFGTFLSVSLRLFAGGFCISIVSNRSKRRESDDLGF